MSRHKPPGDARLPLRIWTGILPQVNVSHPFVPHPQGSVVFVHDLRLSRLAQYPRSLEISCLLHLSNGGRPLHRSRPCERPGRPGRFGTRSLPSKWPENENTALRQTRLDPKCPFTPVQTEDEGCALQACARHSTGLLSTQTNGSSRFEP